MRFFAYQGTDSQGRTTQGTIQAASASEARRLLVGGGVRAADVRELTAVGVSGAPVRPLASTPAAPAPPRPAVIAAPVAAPACAATRFKFAGNKTSFFFFEALGRYIKSGIAPNRALEELGQRARKPWLGERLLQASAAVAKGSSLADALAVCACFPTGCVGTIRAGEASGAVPDACQQAADGCERAHKLGLKCAFMCFFFVLAALYLPLGAGLVNGAVETIGDQWEHDGQLPAGATAVKHMAPLIGRNFLIALPFYVLAFALWCLWLTDRLKLLRHKTILKTPILAGRAREESLARTSWALTELSRAGFSANRAMALASDAAPNLEVARRFRDEASRMREQDRLSVALGHIGLLDPQLVDVVENGELAGDVPGAIASVHRATGAEFQRKDGSAHTKIWAILYPIAGLIIGLMLHHLYKTLILGYFEKIQ